MGGSRKTAPAFAVFATQIAGSGELGIYIGGALFAFEGLVGFLQFALFVFQRADFGFQFLDFGQGFFEGHRVSCVVGGRCGIGTVVAEDDG